MITVTILTLAPLEVLIDSGERVCMILAIVGSCNSGKPSDPLAVERGLLLSNNTDWDSLVLCKADRCAGGNLQAKDSLVLCEEEKRSCSFSFS